MPHDEVSTSDLDQSNQSTSKPAGSGIFAVPAPIRQLFSYFPLLTYPANSLPIRASISRNQHALYIFTTEEGARRSAPSFNPGCLKWQTYLRICQIDFHTVASNNHASPSGALPFLLPSSTGAPTDPIISSRFQKWASGLGKITEDPLDPRFEVYMTLVDKAIRQAWLYSLYLTSNFDSVAVPLYILPATSSSIVRLALARDLRKAAEAELLKTAAVIDAKTLQREANEAFEALDTSLGRHQWFFGCQKPGLLDAAVFAYTHLLLDDTLGNGWSDTTLGCALQSRESLVKHRKRMLEMYY